MVGEADDSHGASQREAEGADDGEVDEAPAVGDGEVRSVQHLASEVRDRGEGEPVVQQRGHNHRGFRQREVANEDWIAGQEEETHGKKDGQAEERIGDADGDQMRVGRSTQRG